MIHVLNLLQRHYNKRNINELKDKWSIQFVWNESEGGTARHELRELADDTSGQKYINAFNDKIAFSTYILIFLG